MSGGLIDYFFLIFIMATKLQAVFQDNEAEQVIKLSKEDGRSVSSYIRKIILDKIKEIEHGKTD